MIFGVFNAFLLGFHHDIYKLWYILEYIFLLVIFLVFKLGFKLVNKNEIFSLVEFHIFVPLFF